MTTADYIISPDISQIDPAQCELVIAVNHRFFQYLVLEERSRVVAMKFYLLPAASEKTPADLLDEMLKSDELLNKEIPVAGLIYLLPENQLVPSAYYDPAINTALMDLVHGDLQKGPLLADQIEDPALHNIYRVPQEIHQLLERKFGSLPCKHFYSLWLKQIKNAGNYSGNNVFAVFYPGELILLLIREGMLQLAQQIRYETAEDVSFHLLNLYNQFNLLPEEQPLRISGMIETDSAMYEELLKYFLNVEIEEPASGLELAEDFKQFPSHFFSPLLKIVPCVL